MNLESGIGFKVILLAGILVFTLLNFVSTGIH